MFGAIGVLVGGAVLSFMAPGYAYTIMSTVVNMATAICYGQYTQAAIILGIGIATAAIQAALKGFGDKVKVFLGFETAASLAEKTATATAQAAIEKTTVEVAKKVLTNVAIGMVYGGVQRHVMDQVQDTDDLLGKVGVSLVGAWGIMMGQGMSSSYLNGGSDGLNAYMNSMELDSNFIISMAYETAEMIATIEVSEELEEEYGEEWWSGILSTSVNTVISAGFDVVRAATHQVIAESQQVKYDEDAEGNRIINGKTADSTVSTENGSKSTWEELGITAEFDEKGIIVKEIMSKYFYFEGDSVNMSVMYKEGYADDWSFDAAWFEYRYGDDLGSIMAEMDAIDGQYLYSDVEAKLVEKGVERSKLDEFMNNLKNVAKAVTEKTYENIKNGVNLGKDLFFENPVMDLGYLLSRDEKVGNIALELFNGLLNHVVPGRTLINKSNPDGLEFYITSSGASGLGVSKAYSLVYMPQNNEIALVDSVGKGITSNAEYALIGGGYMLHFEETNKMDFNDLTGKSVVHTISLPLGVPKLSLNLNYSVSNDIFAMGSGLSYGGGLFNYSYSVMGVDATLKNRYFLDKDFQNFINYIFGSSNRGQYIW